MGRIITNIKQVFYLHSTSSIPYKGNSVLTIKHLHIITIFHNKSNVNDFNYDMPDY